MDPAAVGTDHDRNPVLRDFRLLAPPPYGPMVLAAGVIGEGAPVIVLSLMLAGSSPAGLGDLLALLWVLLAPSSWSPAREMDISPCWRADYGVRAVSNASGDLHLDPSGVLTRQLDIDFVLGAFVAGAGPCRSAGPPARGHGRTTGWDRVAFLVPIFFVTSSVHLDVAALFADPLISAMVPVYALLMLANPRAACPAALSR
jgi:hypothetical protein